MQEVSSPALCGQVFEAAAGAKCSQHLLAEGQSWISAGGGPGH